MNEKFSKKPDPPKSPDTPKRFKKYKPSEVHETRKQVVEDSALKKMAIAFEKLYEKKYDFFDDFFYDDAVEAVEGISASSANVKKFLEYLAGIIEIDKERGNKEEEMVGLFISALVNTGSDDSYTLDIRSLGELISLGYKNQKNVVVKGDLGEYCFAEMEQGKVEVFGDAGGFFCSGMSGGEVTLHGNCSEDTGRFMETEPGISREGDVGTSMEGGLLVVEGDVLVAGQDMSGGKVILHGAVGHISSLMKGGEIEVTNYEPPLDNYRTGGTLTVMGRVINNTISDKWEKDGLPEVKYAINTDDDPAAPLYEAFKEICRELLKKD